MITYEDECVCCPKEMGCLGYSCPNKEVPHYYCDECKEERDLYYFESQELCIECIEHLLEKVE